jgi:hypothetical protein
MDPQIKSESNQSGKPLPAYMYVHASAFLSTHKPQFFLAHIIKPLLSSTHFTQYVLWRDLRVPLLSCDILQPRKVQVSLRESAYLLPVP